MIGLLGLGWHMPFVLLGHQVMQHAQDIILWRSIKITRLLMCSGCVAFPGEMISISPQDENDGFSWDYECYNLLPHVYCTSGGAWCIELPCEHCGFALCFVFRVFVCNWRHTRVMQLASVFFRNTTFVLWSWAFLLQFGYSVCHATLQ